MRIWLDPNSINITWYLPMLFPRLGANNQISGGQLRHAQAADQQLNASIIVQTRLQTPEEFANLLKVQQDGSRAAA